MRVVVLLGAPGAGKGTQAPILADRLHLPHVATGDLFRAAVRDGSPVGIEARRYMERGQLVPDDITVKLWQANIADVVRAHTFKPDIDSLILDGIPRNVSQAAIMRDIIDVKKVFHLSCPDRAQIVARLKKRALKDNRFDDANEEVIRKRLETYEAESKPLLDFYGSDLIHEIDAQQTPVKVTFDILRAIIGGQA